MLNYSMCDLEREVDRTADGQLAGETENKKVFRSIAGLKLRGAPSAFLVGIVRAIVRKEYTKRNGKTIQLRFPFAGDGDGEMFSFHGLPKVKSIPYPPDWQI